MDVQLENGRTYHSYEAGRYVLPNDAPEAERLNHQHKVWLLTLHNQLYRAPIDKSPIKKALDVGTGTGIWAIEFAEKYPSCQVIGTDLSPVHPVRSVPKNCEFMITDADSQNDWNFSGIDYIHSRLLIIGFRNYPAYIKRCFDSLVPGGWLELHEAEFPVKCDDSTRPFAADDDDNATDMTRFSKYVLEAGQKSGIDWDVQNKFPKYLEDAGYINIKREEYKWPIGPWMEKEDKIMGQIGEYMIPNAEALVDNSAAFFTRVLGWSTDEFEAFAKKCKKSISEEARTKHQYLATTVHYAQKPPVDS